MELSFQGVIYIDHVLSFQMVVSRPSGRACWNMHSGQHTSTTTEPSQQSMSLTFHSRPTSPDTLVTPSPRRFRWHQCGTAAVTSLSRLSYVLRSTMTHCTLYEILQPNRAQYINNYLSVYTISVIKICRCHSKYECTVYSM